MIWCKDTNLLISCNTLGGKMWCGGSCGLHGLGELGGGEGECFELAVHGWNLRGWAEF